MTTSIRFATPDDVPVIRDFIHQLAVYENAADQDHATCEKLHQNIFVNKHAEVLVAECDGKPVGFALFFLNFSTWLAKPGIYLEDLFVMPDFRGRGIGKALLAKLADITVQRDYQRLDWACLDWNKPSIDFYRSLGAKPMDEWTTYRLQGDALHALAQAAQNSTLQ